ncbi:recombinase family protein [Streptomyces sp. NBC_01314]|uniref:recombinase family protein n=1 Tax=Streptomyces sp. NBC_01314 TaxID=2903821 RepID=UPI00352BD33F
MHALNQAGRIRVFADKESGKNAEREELWKALDYLREGDTLVVPALDRLGRSIQDLIAIVSGLRKRGIGFTSPHDALDTTTPGERLLFHDKRPRGSGQPPSGMSMHSQLSRCPTVRGHCLRSHT